MVIQFRTRKYPPWIYWVFVVLVSIVGTQVTPADGRPAGSTREGAATRRLHPTTRLGDLTPFTTIASDVLGERTAS